eukprot:CAMPEP_0181293808 /NCGR_PEP_ID=MMETSP1101-20121128/3261_1 /TAXON_ID=46948 /ORGANISM="Rhodomonas abbreviata, Strain Caron Lab Isolate" /LENGTH=38 /DNA_ID= /DNA_START= /DNA_END= /DNA_ORIENTATION=
MHPPAAAAAAAAAAHTQCLLVRARDGVSRLRLSPDAPH